MPQDVASHLRSVPPGQFVRAKPYHLAVGNGWLPLVSVVCSLNQERRAQSGMGIRTADIGQGGDGAHRRARAFFGLFLAYAIHVGPESVKPLEVPE